MAEKISKLAIKVDLQCHRCYKKIQKTLCKLQKREKIMTISYNEKNNTVTISGPFDPQKLIKKLQCKACKVIQDIQIIPDPPPKVDPATKKRAAGTAPKDGPKEQKRPDTAKKGPAPEPCNVINDIKIIVDLPKGPKNPDQKANPKPDLTPDTKSKPTPCHPPVWPPCCWMPYYVPYPGGFRCCWCGRVQGRAADGPPMVAYSGTFQGEYKGYQLAGEEDPSTSCTTM